MVSMVLVVRLGAVGVSEGNTMASDSDCKLVTAADTVEMSGQVLDRSRMLIQITEKVRGRRLE